MRLCVTIAAGAAALAASTATASVNLVPTGFVAVTTGTGSMQISAFRLDGSGERHLTSGRANHEYPSLSPTGDYLLYTGDEGGVSEVYMLNVADPVVPTQVTRPPLTAISASWAPDGKSIAYSALVRGAPAYQIFSARPDGSNAVQLTHTADSGNTQPVFSPDGTRIAYINGRDTTIAGPNGGTVTGIANRIWVMQADGSGAQPLTPGPLDAYPAWLDSTTILFARSSFLSDTSQIVSVGLDGTERVQSPPHQYFVEPRPLPDRKSYGATQENGANLHLVRISRADGAGLGASSTSGFIVDPLPVPASDGSSFTMAWILAQAHPQAPTRSAPYGIYALGAASLLVMLLIGLATYRKTNAC
jgi:Tol biopolymer transport system component